MFLGCFRWAMALWAAQTVNNLPAMQTWARFLGQEDPLKGKGTCSSVLAWRIPWTEEPGGLQSMGSQRVRHDLVTIHTHGFMSNKALLPFSHGRRYKISEDTWNIGQEKRVPRTEQEDVGPGHQAQLQLHWLHSQQTWSSYSLPNAVILYQ